MPKPILVRLGLFVAAVAAGAFAAFGLTGGDSSPAAGGIDIRATVTALEQEVSTISQRQTANDLEMAFAVAPGVAGKNDVNFYLRDVDGDDRPYTRLVARVSYLDAGGVAPRTAEPGQLHEGHWPLDGFDLQLAGRWKFDVAVSRDGMPDTTFGFEVRLPHP